MKILVLEDSTVYSHLLQSHFIDSQVEAVRDTNSALAVMCDWCGPLILVIDWEMPGMDGVDFLVQLRKLSRKHYVYAVLLAGERDKPYITKALSTGADDYLVKPFDEQDLQARFQVAMNTLHLHAQLVKADDRLELLASQDSLTALYNRRALMSLFHKEFLKARRRPFPLSIVMCNIDHFKMVNERLGRAVGDEVLRAVARALKSSSRGSDIVARTGGDEFALVLPDTHAAGGVIFAERVQKYLREEKGLRSLQVPITLSFGIAEVDLNISDEVAISRADFALNAARVEGGDRYQIAQETATSSSETRSISFTRLPPEPGLVIRPDSGNNLK
jgi:diguanylate cyclase (GGDEF)-like protein